MWTHTRLSAIFGGMTQHDLGANLAAARAAAAAGGKPLSFDKLERAIFTTIGEYAPSDEKLRGWHTPGALDPEKTDLVVLTAICAVYGVDPATLHPVIARRLDAFRKLLRRPAKPNGGGDDDMEGPRARRRVLA